MIDELDSQIFTLLLARKFVSGQIQLRKQLDGQSQVDLSRENEVIRRYTEQLGVYGASLAQDILRLSKA